MTMLSNGETKKYRNGFQALLRWLLSPTSSPLSRNTAIGDSALNTAKEVTYNTSVGYL
ncbi:MAG: hypothetical protein IPI88_19285 [Chitinophagaceae bacterium]|nr:hypothetical protein [Chitinophagaceae bacterium]